MRLTTYEVISYLMIDWRRLARRAADAVGTPCYLLVESEIRKNVQRLVGLESSMPLRHWVSLKSQPTTNIVDVARSFGFGVDVVSEYELCAAVESGIPAASILVNGVGKHEWLHRHRIANLRVHFDSIAEVSQLASMARNLGWSVGLRCAISSTGTSESSRDTLHWDQFGMTLDELRLAQRILGEFEVPVRGLHFHLHKSPKQVTDYRDAIDVVAEIDERLGINPLYLDIGGGLPVDGESSREGARFSEAFDLNDFRVMLSRVPLALPSVREIWLENGRFLSGPAGALILKVLDRKERDGVIYLVCDGGRVNHARMAATEIHEILLEPAQVGPRRNTVLCGPTCGSVDRLGCWKLPAALQPGDLVIWRNAGAYHIPLETRFSTGLAPVLWLDANGSLEIIRRRETALEWWAQWGDSGNGVIAGEKVTLGESRIGCGP